jgi:hypothetical protein
MSHDIFDWTKNIIAHKGCAGGTSVMYVERTGRSTSTMWWPRNIRDGLAHCTVQLNIYLSRLTDDELKICMLNQPLIAWEAGYMLQQRMRRQHA